MMADITIMQLTHGAHDTRQAGVCLLEAVAWLAGEKHTDAPACASPILAEYGRALNDAILPRRTDLEPRLRSLAPRLVGTAGRPDLDQRAGLMAADWLIRVYTPAWLRVAGLTEHADALAARDLIRSWDSLPTANVAAAYSAAKDAAYSAAYRAAWSAAKDAAWSAARNAVWSAAKDAAKDAAWSAAEDVAWRAVRDAASSAVYSAAYSAAKDAATDALAPTVRELQDSALDLYDSMIALWEVHDESR
jgi:hypothetical protein